jgi:hypothetical protein
MQPEDRLEALLSARLAAGGRTGPVSLAPEPGDEQLTGLLAVVDALEPLRAVEPDPAFVSALEARLLARVAELNSGAAAADNDAALFDADFPTVTTLSDRRLRNGHNANHQPALPNSGPNDETLPGGSPVLDFPPAEARRARRVTDNGRLFRVLWPAVAAAVVLIFGAGAFTANAEPGSPLFAVRQAGENAQANFASSPTQKVSIELQHAQDRLNNLNNVVRSGDNDGYGPALAALRDAEKSVVSDLASVPAGNDRNTLAAQIDTFQSNEQAGLFGAFRILNWPNRLASTQALGELGVSVPKVTSAEVRSVGNSGHVLVVTGAGFQPGAVFYLNGHQISAAGAVSATSATFPLSDQDRHNLRGDLGIQNPDGTAASAARVTDNDLNDDNGGTGGDDHQPTPGATPNATATGDDHGGGKGGGGPTPTPGGSATPTPTADDHGGSGGSGGGSGNPNP